MDDNQITLDRVVRSLGNLTQVECATLGEALWNIKLSSHLTFPEQSFSVEITVDHALRNEHLSLEKILESIKDFNPAEIDALHTVVMGYIGNTPPSGIRHISNRWGPKVIITNVGMSKSAADDTAIEVFKKCVALLDAANRAKEAGDQESALRLFDQVAAIAKQVGMPDYMLKSLREQFL